MNTDLIESASAGLSPTAWADLRAESERARPSVRPPILPRGRARQKLAAGEPLLHGEPFRGDEAFERAQFARLVEVLGHHPDQVEAAAAIADALESGRLDLGRALEEALAAHADHVESVAGWARLPLRPLADLLELAVRPSLRAVAAAYASLLADAASWPRPYCPLCGAVGSVEQAVRHCPRCATTWPEPVHPLPDAPRAFRLELGEPEPDEALEDLLELD